MTDNIEYSSLSTIDLIIKISEEQDEKALNELLSNRKLFTYGRKRVLLTEYLYLFKKDKFNGLVTVFVEEKNLEQKLDLTYTNTFMKFSNFKSINHNSDGPYCDAQYRALVKKVSNFIEDYSELELEEEVEMLFKRMVNWHIKLSWKEVCRSENILYRRYRWQLPNGTIELMRPYMISVDNFRRWLNQNIENPDPLKIGEKVRVQKEISDWFGYQVFVNPDSIVHIKNVDDDILKVEEYPEDLSTIIAIEKSLNFKKLRPSIQALGPQKIEQLVKKILDGILNDKDKDIKIIEEYGLSKATFSRFAGKDWKSNNQGMVPDLWKNIAKIVSKDPILLDTAIDNKLKPVIDIILNSFQKR